MVHAFIDVKPSNAIGVEFVCLQNIRAAVLIFDTQILQVMYTSAEGVLMSFDFCFGRLNAALCGADIYYIFFCYTCRLFEPHFTKTVQKFFVSERINKQAVIH